MVYILSFVVGLIVAFTFYQYKTIKKLAEDVDANNILIKNLQMVSYRKLPKITSQPVPFEDRDTISGVNLESYPPTYTYKKEENK